MLCVQGQSGRLYLLTHERIYEIDGLGRKVRSTCWEIENGLHFPQVDHLWAMTLALQVDEQRVLRRFPWRKAT